MPTDNSAYRRNIQGTSQTSTRDEENYIPTSREIYEQIANIYEKDKVKGAEFAKRFQQLQNNSSSRYYNPYGKSTNSAITNLANMGIDATGMTTDWFKQNTDWQKYLIFNGTTNSPTSPGKKASAQQVAAYNMWQVAKAAEDTDKVEAEWAAMQEEIFYWTQRKDLNLSDDDIIARIEKEKKTKYPMLYAMDNSREPGKTLMELNRGTTYSKDNMYGAIWAARNGQSAGNMFANNVLSAAGKGVTWQANEEIAARLDRSNSETYSPFSVGMTADDVGLYFNVTGINDKMLAEIEKTIDWDNETDVKMYNKAKDALATTKKAEAEKADLMKQINGWLESGMREDKIKERLNTLLSGNNYPTLKAMDKSINDRQNREDMVQTTYAVDYRKQDIEKYITDTYRYLSSMRSANSIASAGFVSRKSTKTPEQVQEEAIAAWKEQHKTTDEYTNDQLRQVRTQQQAADVAMEGQVPANQQMPTEAEMEAAYDAVHGKGAFKSDMKAGNDVTSAKSAMDAKDQNVRDAYAIVKDATNNAERSVLQGYTGSRQAVQTMMREQRDEWLANGIPEDVMANQTQDSNRGYIESAIGYVPGITKFEEASNSIEKLEKSIADNKEKLGLKWYVGRTNDLTYEVDLDGSKYRVTMLPDLSDIDTIENIDNVSDPRQLYAVFGIGDGEDEDTRIWNTIASDQKAMDAFREKYLSEEKNIQAAAGIEITPEDEEIRSQLRKDEMALEDAKTYVYKNQDQYNKDKAEMDRAQQRRDEYIKRMEAMGADTTSLKIADTVLDSLYSFNDYDATRWEEYNPTHIYTSLLDLGMEKDTVLDMARKEHNEIIEQLKDIEFLEQYLNDNNIALPGDKTGEHDVYGQKIARNSDVWNNIQRRKAKLQRDLKDAEFFEMQFSSDFEQVANGQKEQEKIDFVNYNATHKTNNPYEVPGSLYSAFGNYQNYLTEDEKNTWYYLKAKDNQNGTNKADEYAAFMNDDTYGVLPTRAARGMEEGAKDLTESGVGSFAFTNALAIIMSPYNAVSSALYYAKNAITSDEFNPNSSYLRWSQFRTATREQSAQEILETFGKKDENGNYDQTTFSKIVQGAYEILTNRLDSATNAFTFGAMFGGIGNNMLQEFASAMPMGIAASAEAAARAKEKGATDAQAYGIAAITCFAETATEAISLENMSKALKLGKEAGGGTWKAFLKNWLTKAGLSEAFGESVNDIVENIADEKIMGELSEHSEKVKAYRELGYSPDEAEMMARKDELSGVLRTALISYLSPGLDAFQTAVGRYQYYQAVTADAQSNGQNVSLRQVRQQILKQERQEANAEKQAKKAENEAKKAKPTFTRTETQQQTPTTQSDVMVSEEEARKAMEAKAKTPEMTAAEKFTVDYEILETANGADKSVQTSSVAAVLDNGATQEGTDIANAAATNLADIVQEGKTVSEEVQDLLIGADMAKMDAENVKRGIVYAALGGEESECRQLMQSDAYQNASMDRKATMLVEAMGRDWQNPTIAENVNRNTREYRVACVEGQLMEQGGAITIVDAETEAEVAAMEVDKAQKALDTQKEMEENARRAVTRISHDDLTLNPANDAMTKSLMSALDKLQKQAAVSREYAQSLKNAQDREQAARENVENVKQKVMSDIRQQAEDIVAQEDQQRASANEQAKADAQAAAEQKATQEKIDNETASSNAMDAESFIEQYQPDATEEEKQKIREMFAKAQKEVPAQQGPIYDENGNMTPEAQQRRDRFVKQVSKKFGVNIEIADTTKGGTVDRQNGYYDRKNNRIVIDQNCSVDDAMYFVIGHELTHVAEQSGTYGALQRSLLKMRYGNDDARLAADIRARKALYDERLAKMHEQDSSINATPLTEAEAAQEITADIMGELLRGNKQLIDQLVAEEPSTARRILESIKSFLKKAVGMKGAWKTNAQRTVDLFEQALKDAQANKGKAENSTEVKTEALPDKTMQVTEIYRDDDGNVAERPVTIVGFQDHQDDLYYVTDDGRLISQYNIDEFRSYKQNIGTEKYQKLQGIFKQVRDRYGDQTPFSLPQAQPIATDKDGNELAVELPGGTVAVNNIKYSFDTFTDEEKARVRQALYNVKEEDGSNRFTKEEVDHYLDGAIGIASLIAENRGILDFEANSSQSFLKDNDDYYYTLDASTLCAKRLLYQGTFNAVQHLMPDTVFMPEDLIDLVNIMKQMGYETPCGICYVESRRRWLDKYAGEWLTKYEGEYKPTLADVTTSDGLEELRVAPEGSPERKAYDSFIKAMKAKGSANPKVVQLRTAYAGDIFNKLTDEDVQKVKDIGGLRIQSFSDFETPHLLDMVQAVFDMAARKLTSQAYTKVPNFAWVFGDTGIKINLSEIGKDAGFTIDNGITFEELAAMPYEEAIKHIRMEYDDVEGMPHEEAMKIRDRYTKNVGTILVGISDDHVIAAMGDKDVDFIIPFHQSGWSQEELRKVGVLRNYQDFTDFQNERVILLDKNGKAIREEVTKTFSAKEKESGEVEKWIRNQRGSGKTGFTIEEVNGQTVVRATGYQIQSFKTEADLKKKAIKEREGGRKLKSGEVVERTNFTPVGANYYWDFNKSGQENAKHYLEMCKKDGRMPKFWQFLVDDGDGGFSLPQGNDYRSTAIREGYWKTLTDFKMYENDGYGRMGGEVKGSPQTEVTPNINMNQAYRVMNEYGVREDGTRKLGRKQPNGQWVEMESNNSLPVADPAVQMFVEHMKAKQERRQKRGAVTDRKLTKAQRSLMEEVDNLNALNQRLKDAGYAGDLTISDVDKLMEETNPNKKTQQQFSLPSDDAYMAAVERGDMDTAQQMVDQKANEYLNNMLLPDDSDEAGFKYHRGEAPTKTFKRYAVLNVSPDGFRAAYAGNKNPTPLGVWLDAQNLESYLSDKTQFEDGSFASYIVGDTGAPAKEKFSPELLKQYGLKPNTKLLLERGGKHSSDVPNFSQMNLKKDENGNPVKNAKGDGALPHNKLIFEIEYGISDNGDLTDYVKEHGRIAAGGKNQGLAKIQPNQYYDFKTNPNAVGNWGIGGTFRIVRLVPYEEIVDKTNQYRKDAVETANRLYENGEISKSDRDKTVKSAESLQVQKWVGGYHPEDFGLSPQSVDEMVQEGYKMKLTDPVTYDDNGNVIPLSERFNEQKSDIRYSLPSDAHYMAAVERGEMDEAQMMVDEKAKEAGYTVKAYHGTPNGKFNVFEKSKVGTSTDFGKLGRGFYFTTKKQVADYYAGYLNSSTVMPVYLKLTNPFVLDENYDNMTVRELYDSILGEGGPVDERRSEELTRWLIDHGYDGVIADNEYMVLDSNNIKSADIVTYDDNGNVIPLSERFNDQNPDIRYSLPSDDLLEQQIRQYIRNGGSIPNQNPNTAPAPRFNQPETGTGYRQWGNEMAQESDELFQQVKDTVLNSEYTKDTNAAQLNRALDWIQGNRSKYDPDGYITSLQKLINNKNSYRTKDGQAKMVAMMALAAAKGDVSGQVDLADIYNKQGTALGQALQARKLFKLMTPEGRIASMRKMISDQQQVLDGRGVDVELKLSDAIYQAAAYATEDGEFDKVRQAAYEELAQQIPASWKDKLRSWRMLSMLANPRTHIRNMVGNALFVPAVGIKNKIGAVIEQVTGAERTKTTSVLLDKDIRDFARQDAVKMKDVLTGEAKFSEASQIAKSQTKLGKFLDAIRNKNSEWLEKEDWFFLKGHYRRALGGWMQANGYTVEQMNANPELLEQGREYAIAEAQKATYRDFNKTASMLNDVSRKGGLPGFIVDAALPFKKTPANILKRGIEYSPVGLVKSLTADMIHMKQYLDAVKNDKAIPDKALSPTQVVDHLCAGLSGTAITILGFLLAGSGAVTCGLDDDEDKLKKLNGAQEYSIKLFGTDVTFTMDWAAPMSMPFFVGAAIRDQFDKEGGADINEVVNALGNIAEPVFNLSMLDGVNSLFKTSQYDDTNALTQILAKIVTNYGTSYVPSALGATTRTLFDDTRRKSYVTTGENTGIEGTLRYAWEQVENKIPGLSKTNIPYRDVWGNAETSGLAERIFENFISPGYVNNYKDDLVVNELSRLYEATGDAAMIPEEAKKSITYKNTKYNLSPEDYDKLVVTRGQAAYNGLAQLMNSDAYKRASAEEQKEQVKKVWSYADQLGKAAVIPDYKITAATSVDEAATSGTVAYYQDAMITSLDSGDYTAYDTCIQALHDSGYEDSKIKTKISNTYRDKYKDAYRKKDYVTMLDIEDMLDRTGYDFDYQKWQDAVDGEV